MDFPEEEEKSGQAGGVSLRTERGEQGRLAIGFLEEKQNQSRPVMDLLEEKNESRADRRWIGPKGKEGRAGWW